MLHSDGHIFYNNKKSTGTKKAPSHEATLFCTLP